MPLSFIIIFLQEPVKDLSRLPRTLEVSPPRSSPLKSRRQVRRSCWRLLYWTTHLCKYIGLGSSFQCTYCHQPEKPTRKVDSLILILPLRESKVIWQCRVDYRYCFIVRNHHLLLKRMCLYFLKYFRGLFFFGTYL